MLMRGLPPADSTDLSEVVPNESEVRWGDEAGAAAFVSADTSDNINC